MHKENFSIVKTLLVSVLLFIVGAFFFGTKNPLEEGCVVTNVIATDPDSGHFIKYVECMKGISSDMFPDGGTHLESESVASFIVFDKNNEQISTLPINKWTNRQFFGQYAPFPTNNFSGGYFIVTPNSGSHDLYQFKNDNVKVIRSVPYVGGKILAYENDDVYYLDGEQYVKKDNVLNGSSLLISDLSSIKGDNSMLYNIDVKRSNNVLTMSFTITIPYKSASLYQEDEYSLNLYSGELKKVGSSQFTGNSAPIVYNVPSIGYSITSSAAQTFGLSYNKNMKIDLYSLLLFFKSKEKLSQIHF